jgi:2-methylfumaryl-CoA hydratase
MMDKTHRGNFFEDFRLGFELRHPTPRTVTEGDVALYGALYGGRFALASSTEFAVACGLKPRPVDDLLVFHLVFGKSVPDISVNAVANLGYAEGRFCAPVHPGDTLCATSKVIGLKENANRQTGIVYVRTSGFNQQGETVLEFVRWVMVRKRDQNSEPPPATVPEVAPYVLPARLSLPPGLNFADYDPVLAGSPHFWEDYAAGERIDHVDGMTIEEAEHMLATRLYQNTAKVHFNQHAEASGRFGRRLVYGGHIISLARALSFNGLGNAVKIAAINGGRHVAPCFAGDTIYAWSRIEACWEIEGRPDIGAIRIKTFAAKDQPCADFPGDEEPHPQLVLEFDYTVLMPRRF